MIENCVVYIIGKLDDGGSFSNPSVIQKKRHSSSIEGRHKILKTEKSFKSGNYKNNHLNKLIGFTNCACSLLYIKNQIRY